MSRANPLVGYDKRNDAVLEQILWSKYFSKSCLKKWNILQADHYTSSLQQTTDHTPASGFRIQLATKCKAINRIKEARKLLSVFIVFVVVGASPLSQEDDNTQRTRTAFHVTIVHKRPHDHGWVRRASGAILIRALDLPFRDKDAEG